MRKALVVVSLALILLTAGIFGMYIYESVDERAVPSVAVYAFGAELAPVAYDWEAAVFKGLVYKSFSSENISAAVDLGEIPHGPAAFSSPAGYDASFELTCDSVLISRGSGEELDEGLYEEPGSYELFFLLEKAKERFKAYGLFSFLLKFTIPEPEPEFLTGGTNLFQGEIFVMKLSNVTKDVIPSAETELGFSIFTPLAGGEWFAAVPIGNTRRPGDYAVKVSAGKYRWETVVTVKAYNFTTQNLIIDTTDPVISEANSPAAYQQYREKIPPLYNTYDDDIYWKDVFIWPVKSRISTQFGAIRYTNSNWSNPGYHWGVDIAADKGTPVKAPNDGRVVLAEYLLNTGNTLVIEHGGGLKSYFYHMDSLSVSAGTMVQKGAVVGEVGSTGYSTGPHLHFEMRIGNQAVNPLMLFEGSASLYALTDDR